MTLLDAPPGRKAQAHAQPAPGLLTRAALPLALVVAFPVLVMALDASSSSSTSRWRRWRRWRR